MVKNSVLASLLFFKEWRFERALKVVKKYLEGTLGSIYISCLGGFLDCLSVEKELCNALFVQVYTKPETRSVKSPMEYKCG